MLQSLGNLFKKQSFQVLTTAFVSAIILTSILQNFDFYRLEARFYDVSMKLKSKAFDHHEHIALVSLDDASFESLQEIPPLKFEHHITALKNLAATKPRAIAFFIDFNEVHELSPTGLRSFHELASDLHDAGTEVFFSDDVDVTGEVHPPSPLNLLPHGLSLIHKDGTSFAEDKVTRRALFAVGGEPTLHVLLASRETGTVDPAHYQGLVRSDEVDSNFFLVNYVGDTRNGRHPFVENSFQQIFENKFNPADFKDKIVLVGVKTNKDAGSYALTPYSRKHFENSKLVIHANIIETLIHDRAIIPANRWINIVFTFCLTLLVTWIVLVTTPVRSLMVTVASAVAVFLITLFSFGFFHYWISVSHSLIGTFTAYYLFVPYRLIREYKIRWNYQQQTTVLRQVEELKSNFMNLITHDLKTPVARIQGMAEILQTSGANADVVEGILSSTSDLNSFISSILELAKIESDRVQLHKVSRDVNRLIEEVTEKLSFEADRKKISLVTNLEPLFPVKIDSRLVSKIVANLIDNAIKYSAEGTTITVSSKESEAKPGYLEISVTDEGVGISPIDLEQLFTKFFRAKSDATIRTKGSGLGLFLSRYFAELHNGLLEVKSVMGTGSTFTLYIPNEDEPLHPVSKNERSVLHA